MWTRGQLKENAKNKLRAYYWSGFLVTLISSFIGGGGGGVSYSLNGFRNGFQTQENLKGNSIFEYTHEIPSVLIVFLLVLAVVVLVAGIAFTAFLGNPIAVGVKRYFLLSGEIITGGRKPEISEIFFVFRKGRYKNVVKVMFLRDLYTFLWTLLFIVPGIIKSYEYSMIPYLLAEDPNMDSHQVFKLSWEMTDGNKGDIFVLDLSFLGWMFLGALVCGIGTLFVQPYVEATYVELFLALKAKIYYRRQQQEQQSINDIWQDSRG